MMNQQVKSHLALLGTNIIYGLNYVIAKGIMPDYLMPRAIIFLRVSVTVFIFWILHLIIPSEKVEKRDFFKLAICAVFGVAFNQILFFEGLNLSTPINASIIITVIPLVILIFSHLFLKEKITSIKIFGIILGATGALLVILSSGNGDFGSGTMLGDFMIFVNSVSWALYLVLIKPLMEKYNSITIMKWIFTFGLIIIFPFTFKSFSASTFSSIPLHIWMSISFVVFGATIIAYFLNNYSLKTVSASVNGIYIYLQPLVASIAAILFGKDHLTLIKTIAAIMIMTGVFFVTRRNKVNNPALPFS
jgi:drug/metabolite transporter (DMT)-like permease